MGGERERERDREREKGRERMKECFEEEALKSQNNKEGL